MWRSCCQSLKMLFPGCKLAVSVEPGSMDSLLVWECWCRCLLHILFPLECHSSSPPLWVSPEAPSKLTRLCLIQYVLLPRRTRAALTQSADWVKRSFLVGKDRR